MPVQTPLWTDFLSCPVCQNQFQVDDRLPISLSCGHTMCTSCLGSLQGNQCPFDQSKIGLSMNKLPVNTALLKLVGNGHVPDNLRTVGELSKKDREVYHECMKCMEGLALFLKSQSTSQLSRPMQKKLVILVTSQLLNDEGRAKGVRAARSVGERSVLELILQHQNPFHLSTNLWAAVRARGCQFLGPPMQEDVLKLVLEALKDGTALSRKVLVMFVVQRLVKASKTSIGHVVQLLYRASCFKVTKREGDSSLMQLKEELRTYDSLRKEHDTQIVQIATEAGLRIGPDQWSSLLYGDYAHKSHMQSIIDKLQSPQSFSSSVQELLLALQRTGDPGNLSSIRSHLQVLTNIDPNIESTAEPQSWSSTLTALRAADAVISGLLKFSAINGAKMTGEGHSGHLSKYKTSICRDFSQFGCCARGPNCTFAHCSAELEYHRGKNARGREPTTSTISRQNAARVNSSNNNDNNNTKTGPSQSSRQESSTHDSAFNNSRYESSSGYKNAVQFDQDDYCGDKAEDKVHRFNVTCPPPPPTARAGSGGGYSDAVRRKQNAGVESSDTGQKRVKVERGGRGGNEFNFVNEGVSNVRSAHVHTRTSTNVSAGDSSIDQRKEEDRESVTSQEDDELQDSDVPNMEPINGPGMLSQNPGNTLSQLQYSQELKDRATFSSKQQELEGTGAGGQQYLLSQQRLQRPAVVSTSDMPNQNNSVLTSMAQNTFGSSISNSNQAQYPQLAGAYQAKVQQTESIRHTTNTSMASSMGNNDNPIASIQSDTDNRPSCSDQLPSKVATRLPMMKYQDQIQTTPHHGQKSSTAQAVESQRVRATVQLPSSNMGGSSLHGLTQTVNSGACRPHTIQTVTTPNPGLSMPLEARTGRGLPALQLQIQQIQPQQAPVVGASQQQAVMAQLQQQHGSTSQQQAATVIAQPQQPGGSSNQQQTAVIAQLQQHAGSSSQQQGTVMAQLQQHGSNGNQLSAPAAAVLAQLQQHNGSGSQQQAAVMAQLQHHGGSSSQQQGTVMAQFQQHGGSGGKQQAAVMAQLQQQHGGTGSQQHAAVMAQLQQHGGSGNQQQAAVMAQLQVSPIVDANGAPLIDMATGQPLVAHTPVIASPAIHPLHDATTMLQQNLNHDNTSTIVHGKVPVENTTLVQNMADGRTLVQNMVDGGSSIVQNMADGSTIVQNMGNGSGAIVQNMVDGSTLVQNMPPGAPEQGNVGAGGGTTLVQNMMAGTESIVQNVLVDHHHHGTGGAAAIVQNIVEGSATMVPPPQIPMQAAGVNTVNDSVILQAANTAPTNPHHLQSQVAAVPPQAAAAAAVHVQALQALQAVQAPAGAIHLQAVPPAAQPQAPVQQQAAIHVQAVQAAQAAAVAQQPQLHHSTTVHVQTVQAAAGAATPAAVHHVQAVQQAATPAAAANAVQAVQAVQAVAAAAVQSNTVQGVHAVQANTGGGGATPLATPAPPQAAQPTHLQQTHVPPVNIVPIQDAMRRMSHDVSPEIASKSLQALEDRKEEIISELGDIVGPTAAKAIENLTHKQASKQKFGIDAVKQASPAFETTTVTNQNAVYGIWTSKPIATIASILQVNKAPPRLQEGEPNPIQQVKKKMIEDDISPLPEGICVSKFGPISRRSNLTLSTSTSHNTLARSVTADIPTEKTLINSLSLTQPRTSLTTINLPKAQMEQKTNVLEYNPGYYYDHIEGLDSVTMSHLMNPPLVPGSPLPPVTPVRGRDSSISEQNYSFLVESNRIQNELKELQRRLSCLSVAENSAQMVLKRDRLAFELRMVEGGIQERHKLLNTNDFTS